MRLRWPGFLVSLGALFASGAPEHPEKYDLRPAPESLFERQPLRFDCTEFPPAANAKHPDVFLLVFPAGEKAPRVMTRQETFNLPSSEFPALTVTADPSNHVAIGGSDRSDLQVRFCARGQSQSEDEARELVQQISLTRNGSFLSLNNPGGGAGASGSLLLDAPAGLQAVIHASYSSVEVRDMGGPVRVTASHGRATILDSTGQLDADAFVIDFAGSRGRVTLSAEAEINVKFTAPRYLGTLMAWAQGPVRVLVPVGFETPFQAVVNRPQEFACRADFCSKVRQEKKNSLYVFTYDGDGSAPPERVHLRSEQSTVVIDSIPRKN